MSDDLITLSKGELESIILHQLQDKTECLQIELNQYKFALAEIKDLMEESHGVSGLHLNGDIACWGELLGNSWLPITNQLLYPTKNEEEK